MNFDGHCSINSLIASYNSYLTRIKGIDKLFFRGEVEPGSRVGSAPHRVDWEVGWRGVRRTATRTGRSGLPRHLTAPEPSIFRYNKDPGRRTDRLSRSQPRRRADPR